MVKKRFTVVLADDHPAMRESIAAAVEDFHNKVLEVVSHAGDGVAVIDEVKKHQPDLLLLDIGMPRLDGIRAIPQIKKISPKTTVFILSMYDDQAHVVEAIRAGADDYLFKNEATPSLVTERMLQALDKKIAIHGTLQSRLVAAVRTMDEENLELGVTKLTAAELAVLKLAAYRGYSVKEIAQSLGADGKAVSELTIRKHFEHIYEKLGAKNQAHAVCLAVKHGFISSEGAEPR